MDHGLLSAAICAKSPAVFDLLAAALTRNHDGRLSYSRPRAGLHYDTGMSLGEPCPHVRGALRRPSSESPLAWGQLGNHKSGQFGNKTPSKESIFLACETSNPSLNGVAKR